MNQIEAITYFSELMFPYTQSRFAEVKEKGLKMAHYTSAENASLILKNQTLWLRNATLMNDFSEVTYGSNCLKMTLSSGLRAKLEAALDAQHPGLCKAVLAQLDDHDTLARKFTYLTSLSAHDPDNLLGRLSMWRAYGGQTSGVALIFNTDMFEVNSTQLQAYSSPVLYGSEVEYAHELSKVITNIEQNQSLLSGIPFQSAQSILFNALQFSILSTKHPAFEEEQEWRVIHSPMMNPSAFIQSAVHTIRGIPQMVCELPLRNQPGLNMPNMDLENLLNRIIIGPCAHPHEVAWGFREILREIGITNPDSRISIANIPLRQHR